MKILATLVVTIAAIIALGSCSNEPAANVLPAPGASWTKARLPGASFVQPEPTMSRLTELNFWTGFALFRDPWVAAPSSTTARDGLGPLFSARSCLACHEDAGRGDSVIHNPETFSTVYRVRQQGELASRYGTHLQPRATFDLDEQGRRVIGFFAGEPRPQVALHTIDLPQSEIDLHEIRAQVGGETVSPRVAPAMVGLHLLEAIPESRLRALAKAQHDDKTDVSGRINWVDDSSGQRRAGRFGWKASQASVAMQSADAFRNDIGITSELEPDESCTPSQTRCQQQTKGNGPRGAHEINDPLFAHVVTFTRSLAVPSARVLTPKRKRGRALFQQAGCQSCHTPSHEIELAGQTETIWPYTDLLLHDMGPLLADGVREADANGSEWRTPPLWSLGVAMELNPDTGLLHDGRAATVQEAVLWHGGEAAKSAAFYLQLSSDDQDALASFVLAL